jgi:hypothetical protein
VAEGRRSGYEREKVQRYLREKLITWKIPGQGYSVLTCQYEHNKRHDGSPVFDPIGIGANSAVHCDSPFVLRDVGLGRGRFGL